MTLLLGIMYTLTLLLRMACDLVARGRGRGVS